MSSPCQSRSLRNSSPSLGNLTISRAASSIRYTIDIHSYAKSAFISEICTLRSFLFLFFFLFWTIYSPIGSPDFVLLTHMPLYIFFFPPSSSLLHLLLICMSACAMISNPPPSSSKRSTQKHPMPSPSLHPPTRPDPPMISTAQTRVTAPTTTLPTGHAATALTAPPLLPALAPVLMSSVPAAPATKMVSQPFLFSKHIGFLPLASTNLHKPLQ